ncbi:MAG: transketolase [Proteobacteria bacterium]|nr:transketolase [Pseudomonadota bacterium]
MDKNALAATALTVRLLSIDAIEQAKSGHPGLPLGCAELGSLIFGELLKHYPEKPDWPNRDRFVLSAGHGSMLLYSLLHLSGYALSLDDIRSFRQLGSRTPGHPEYGITPGVETTTGQLGQGFANAVGMAMAEKMLSSRFNTEKRCLINHYTYVLAGDGDMMEGVAGEAASLAGHLGLEKLIVFYDANHITSDGSTAISFTEDVGARFQAYGWQTLDGNAYDPEEILGLVERAKGETEKPTLIRLESTIGKGSPGLVGSHKAHGGALGEEELRRTKKELGIDEDSRFYISPEVAPYFSRKNEEWRTNFQQWQKIFEAWKEENPQLLEEWNVLFDKTPKDYRNIVPRIFEVNESVPTRIAGGRILDFLTQTCRELVGGTADLTVPCFGRELDLEYFQKDNPAGRLVPFGIREHAMGAISNGIALYGGLRPFCATFLAFSDYMRPAIRLSALMKLPVIYVMTHDTVLIGEDGPTHQPVEHLAALRTIPNLLVLRPGDAQETEAAWMMAMERTDGPTVIALTRQDVDVFSKADPEWRETIRKGAYIVRNPPDEPDIVLIATGSEVQTAIDACTPMPTDLNIRIVSMISRELFFAQNDEFRNGMLPEKAEKIVVEAGTAQGWEKIFVERPAIVSIEQFGLSAPGEQAADSLGLNVNSVRKKIDDVQSRRS